MARKSKSRKKLKATIGASIQVLLHAALLGGLFYLLDSMIDRWGKLWSEFGVDLPAPTVVVMSLVQAIHGYPVLLVSFVAVVLLLDGLIFYALHRRGRTARFFFRPHSGARTSTVWGVSIGLLILVVGALLVAALYLPFLISFGTVPGRG